MPPVQTFAQRLAPAKRAAYRSYQRALSPLVAKAFSGRERAACGLFTCDEFDADTFLRATMQGYFVTSDQGSVQYNSPEQRYHIPVQDYHIPKNLRRAVNKKLFDIRWDTDLAGVMDGCAATRNDSWIIDPLRDVHMELFDRGIAHSVEAWQDGELVGGLFGFAINGYFSTESVFYKVPNASKVACYYLLEHLKNRGYLIHDVQMLSNLSGQLGAEPLGRKEFHRQLFTSLTTANVSFGAPAPILVDPKASHHQVPQPCETEKRRVVVQ